MKEQIEEMGKLCPFHEEGKCNLLGDTRCDFDCDMCDFARTLYNAGYRKQKEGEWIKHFASYECTVCKQEFCVSEYAEDYDPIEDYDLHFCPNCGAHMKGGAE